MTVRRTRPTAPPANTPRTADVLARRRQPATPKESPAPATRALRRQAPQSQSQVVHAPNSDEIYGDAIRSMRNQRRPFRGGDYLHVSDLIGKCIRAKSLVAEYELEQLHQSLTLSDIMTFAQGDAIHDAAKALARDGSPHLVWGKWSCKCEYLFHEEPCLYSEIDQEEECPHCHGKVDRYHEVSVFDEEYGVVGNPDLVFYIPRSQAFHVNEIKSISHDQWKDLARPKPEHVMQVVWYWHLMHRQGKRMTDRCSIVYFTKGWLFGNQVNYKEFVIEPEPWIRRLADQIEDAKAYKAHRLALAAGEETLPPLPVRTCTSKESKEAKGCVACDLCFRL